jgi:glutamate N-acetyltransferase/amino-acid N-acetyltransferase
VQTSRAGSQAEFIEGGGVTSTAGFSAGAVYAGIKTPGEGKLDVGLLASDRPCVAAAMFTQSAVKGAPVILSQEHVADGRALAIVVNAGISNVAMGATGMANAREMWDLAAASRSTPDTRTRARSPVRSATSASSWRGCSRATARAPRS